MSHKHPKNPTKSQIQATYTQIPKPPPNHHKNSLLARPKVKNKIYPGIQPNSS